MRKPDQKIQFDNKETNAESLYDITMLRERGRSTVSHFCAPRNAYDQMPFTLRYYAHTCEFDVI